MSLFTRLDEQEYCRIQLFAIEVGGTYKNVFSLFKLETNAIPLEQVHEENIVWQQRKGKKRLRLFQSLVTVDKAEQMFSKIEISKMVSFAYGQNTVTIQFGELIRRSMTFLANEPGSSVANGWWPGTLQDGFDIQTLYADSNTCLSGESEQVRRNVFEFVKKESGMDLAHLRDYAGNLLFITPHLTPFVECHFNHETMKQTLTLIGDVPPKSRRVVLSFWEGDECSINYIQDLDPTSTFCAVDVPFYPTRCGYELYEYSGGLWRLVKKRSCFLVRQINIGMDIITGTLAVRNSNGEQVEQHSIVQRQRPTIIGNETYQTQPWILAERERNRANRGIEVRQLGSIFMPLDQGSPGRAWSLIKNEIIESAKNRIWLWDPYLDASILDTFVILGLRYSQLDIRWLMSEVLGERIGQPGQQPTMSDKGSVFSKLLRTLLKCSRSTDTKATIGPSDAILQLPRCKTIYDYFQHPETQGERLRNQGNFKVRNWYRSGKHSFHDRFIIVDDSVWHVGCSLKDIGSYHSTIYRLDGDIPNQVIEEYQKTWEGSFGPMRLTGLEVFPDLKFIDRR